MFLLNFKSGLHVRFFKAYGCFNRKSLKKDLSLARSLYLKAAAQNEVSAQHNLGHLHANGQGVDVDAKEALKWYSKAAENGSVSSLVSIGEIHEFGIGVKEDATEGAKFYQRASDLGDRWASAFLATLYEQGVGVNHDSKEAKRLREMVDKHFGKDAEQVMLWSANRMVIGTWRFPAKVGNERFVLTLSLFPNGKGQFYLFKPTKADDTEGALKVGSLAYKVERRSGDTKLVLEGCRFLSDKTVKLGIASKGNSIQIKDGMATWSDQEKIAFPLSGTWASLGMQDAYGGFAIGDLDFAKITFGSKEK